jgi:hypothetical protein
LRAVLAAQGCPQRRTGRTHVIGRFCVCNLDNFIKTLPIQEGEPGFIESAPDA